MLFPGAYPRSFNGNRKDAATGKGPGDLNVTYAPPTACQKAVSSLAPSYISLPSEIQWIDLPKDFGLCSVTRVTCMKQDSSSVVGENGVFSKSRARWKEQVLSIHISSESTPA